MPLRIRYRGTELSEGLVEVIEQASGFHIHDDNTLELRGDDEEVVGEVHPDRWVSVVKLVDA